MSKLKFKIVTPDRVVYQADEVDGVTIPTTTGQITVLPGHIPLASLLTAGELVIRKDQTEISMAVSGGFIEVASSNELTILADAAERAEELDETRIQAARDRANQLKANQEHLAEEDFARFQALIDHELARLKVAEKHRRRH